jgi:hypothetical protein
MLGNTLHQRAKLTIYIPGGKSYDEILKKTFRGITEQSGYTRCLGD